MADICLHCDTYRAVLRQAAGALQSVRNAGPEVDAAHGAVLDALSRPPIHIVESAADRVLSADDDVHARVVGARHDTEPCPTLPPDEHDEAARGELHIDPVIDHA